MTKPSIFFSHSTRDKAVVCRLKDAFVGKTGSTIDVFVSSDGQSIRFGKNWVHEIEEALERCRILFVFVTPSALQSQWIFFEAGYAYSKGIQVVPVGALGIDLNDIPPPLGLLQGFNLTGSGGLNNLLATTNRELQHTFEESFEDADYRRIIGGDGSSLVPFGEYGHLFDELEVTGSQIPDATTRFITLLQEEGFEVGQLGATIFAEGITMTEAGYIHADPDVAANRFPLLLKLAGATTSNDDPLRIIVHLRPDVRCEARSHIVTGRLAGAGITIAPKQNLSAVQLAWRGVSFALWHSAGNRVEVIVDPAAGTELTSQMLGELVGILVERKILLVG